MNASVLIGQALISLLGIVILAVIHYWSVRAVVLVSVVTAGVGALAFFLLIPKTVLFSDWPNIFSLRRTARELWGSLAAPAVEDSNVDDVESVSTFAFFMFLSSLFVMLTLKADVWLMGVFLDKESIGVYSVAQRFTLPLAIILAALSTALWPRASSLTTNQGVRVLLARTLKVCFLIALLGCAYSLLIPFLAPYLFGRVYEKSVLPGQLLCIGYVVAILVCPIGIIGYSMGLVSVYWLANFIQLCLTVLLLVIMLPVIGPVGAALSFVASNAVGGAIVGFLLWRRTAALSVASCGKLR
jgi:O-antigen/teichoic acid export membrane protein